MVIDIRLSERQEKILEIVKENQPITGEDIASRLSLTRATLRPDLSILTMVGMLDARPRVGYFYTGTNIFNDIGEQIKGIVVEEIQSVPIVLEESTTVYDAIVFMFLENIGSIYITDKGKLSGVVSRKDIIRTLMGKIDLHQVPIGLAMTRMPNIIYVEAKDKVLDAAIKLIDHEIDSLPVVEYIDEERKDIRVIGRITKTNITRLFVELGKNR